MGSVINYSPFVLQHP
ncbi:hypothetical protein ACVV4J_01815 [Escherichia coli]